MPETQNHVRDLILCFSHLKTKQGKTKQNKQKTSFPIYLESALSNHESPLSNLDIVYKLKPFIHVPLRLAPFMSCMDFGIHDSHAVIGRYNNPLCGCLTFPLYIYQFPTASPSRGCEHWDVSLSVNTGVPFSLGIVL